MSATTRLFVCFFYPSSGVRLPSKW